MSLLDQSSIEAVGSLLMMGCAGLVAFFSGACFIAFPLILWMVFGDLHGPGLWGMLWALLTLGVIFFNIIKALAVIRHQKSRDLALMLSASALVVLSSPITLRAIF